MELDQRTVNEFICCVSRWNLTSTAQDDVVSGSLEVFFKKSSVEAVSQPNRFLLGIAKYISKELRRREMQIATSREAYAACYLSEHHHNRMCIRRCKPASADLTLASRDFGQSPAWRALDEQHRELFRLTKVEKLPVAEAARILGVNESTAKSWIERDTRRLRKCPILKRLSDSQRFDTDGGTA